MNHGVDGIGGRAGLNMGRHQIEGFNDQSPGLADAFDLIGCFDPDAVLFGVMLVGWLGGNGFIDTATLVFFPAAAGTGGIPADFPAIRSVFHVWFPLLFRRLMVFDRPRHRA